MILHQLSFELAAIVLYVSSSAAHPAKSTSSGTDYADLLLSHTRRPGLRSDSVTDSLSSWSQFQSTNMHFKYGRRRYAPAGGIDTSPIRRQARLAEEDMYNLYSDAEVCFNTQCVIGSGLKREKFYARVKLGELSQLFNLVLDTGSADMWTANNECVGCPTETHLYTPGNSPFDEGAIIQPKVHSSSVALPRPEQSGQVMGQVGDAFSVSYGSGSASGKLVSDTVSMAERFTQQPIFGSCSNVTEGLIAGGVSGVMVLAFDNIARSKIMPFWQALAETNQLGQSPEMGFAFTRRLHTTSPSALPEYGGAFSLGKANGTLYTGNVSWNPLSEAGFWMISMKDVTVQGYKLGISSSKVAIDTGTSLTGAPADAVQYIFSHIPGAIEATDVKYRGYYYIPCATNVNLSLTFNGATWPISPNDLNIGVVSTNTNSDNISESMCLGGIFALAAHHDRSSNAPEWVIGTTFLKNVYSIFRYRNPQAVGFAHLLTTALAWNVPPQGHSGLDSSETSIKSSGTARNYYSPTRIALRAFLLACALQRCM